LRRKKGGTVNVPVVNEGVPVVVAEPNPFKIEYVEHPPNYINADRIDMRTLDGGAIYYSPDPSAYQAKGYSPDDALDDLYRKYYAAQDERNRVMAESMELLRQAEKKIDLLKAQVSDLEHGNRVLSTENKDLTMDANLLYVRLMALADRLDSEGYKPAFEVAKEIREIFN
jgi:hypothetical protein